MAQEFQPARGRLLFLIVLTGLVVLIFSAYLFSLQVINQVFYQNKARQVSSRIIELPAQRGEIFDRFYNSPVVTNIPSFALDIIPGGMSDEELQRTLEKTAALLGIAAEDLSAKIYGDFRRQYQPIELRDAVPYDIIVKIAENIEDYPGISWHSKPIRNYIYNETLSHVTGYVGTITSEELQVLYNQGYSYNSTIGKSGIERQYDTILRGSDGRSFQTVDVKGRSLALGSDQDIPPQNGNHLVLTIDRSLQELCQKALGPRIGSVVALKPHTGEVLALVSYPNFDPNIFYEDVRGEKYRAYSRDPRFPFINRAIQSGYAPASTFKVLISAAVLQEKAFDPDKKINCTGRVYFGDRYFHCHKKTGHGPLNLEEALAQSCNVYFWTVGTEYLGIENIKRYAEDFGLGRKTGIDLIGESRGLVPSPQWKEQVYHSPWLGGDTMNISIGQGALNVTPLQMANLVAMIVNDGTIYRPHLLKEIRDPVTGEVLSRTEPEVLHQSRLMEPETFRKLREAMRGVITEGTARWVITTQAVEIAAKTGTGQVGREDQFSSWFVSYGPYGAAPEETIVLVVNVEGTNKWEWWAPKAADMIFQGYFAEQSYEEVLNEFRNVWYLRELRQNSEEN